MADNSPPQSRSTNFISSWLRRLCCSVLQAGEIPRHVAIIMDGNRRFAKKMKQERAFGHILGFEKLLEVNTSLTDILYVWVILLVDILQNK